MHSYKSDIADVLLIKFLSGSSSFLPKRGSCGIKHPNNLIILIKTQLLLLLLISRSKIGESGK